VFAPKHNVNHYLEEKAAAGEIEYTVIANGALFDWGKCHFPKPKSIF
jgi:hypothetical protein